MSKWRKGLSNFLLGLCAAWAPFAAHADTDACTLVTPSQVGAAVGVAVGEGTHVTPNFVKTCTWSPTAKAAIVAVTLNLQTAAFYDGGKRQAALGAAAGGKGIAMKQASAGDDAYYFTAGDQVALFVKKGPVSFKVAVYARIPAGDKEAMEARLAAAVLGKL